MRNPIPTTAVVLALACASAPSAPSRHETRGPIQPIRDTALGLSRTSVFEATAPPASRANESAPGELPAVPAAFAGSPPPVPHSVRDFLPITREANACFDCHSVKRKEQGQPTPIPASHYTDMRRAPDAPGERIAGARWVCTSCHASRTDATPLVPSSFRSSNR